MFKDFDKPLLSNGLYHISKQKYHKLFINEYLSNYAKLVNSLFYCKVLLASELNPKFKIHNFASLLMLILLTHPLQNFGIQLN